VSKKYHDAIVFFVKRAQRQGMQFGISIVNGFCFGSGLILAAAFFKAALHMGFCG
jgi:hypothetical protein